MEIKMSGSVTALEKIDQILRLVTKISRKVDFLESTIEEALFDEEDVTETKRSTKSTQEHQVSHYDDDGNAPTEEMIKQRGQKIPYMKYSGKDADKFREFIVFMKDNPGIFNDIELATAGFADKNFDDIHISANTYRLLNQAYKKTHRSHEMPWHYTPGFLYKYGVHKHWEWDE